MKKLASTVFALGLTVVIGAAQAADAPPTRLRGTIDQVDGQTLHVTSRSGEKLVVTLTPDAKVVDVSKIDISAIKPNSYIGTAAAPLPDGSLKALEVHVFPESMRGSGDGHRPFDLGPNSTMTNGTVGSVVGTSDRTLTVKYEGGEKKVVVPADVPIVTFEPGTLGELKAGAHIIVSAMKGADGNLTTNRVSVGKDGLTPPM
ncbi:MAG TPA: hypothetical protein VGV37_21095 [Aliidongia sp.]|uniref:hypothetical protein n=1 Tax=Aliidongia sp. TaxID=1914230 RepID=UPI002DDCCDE1|nr:hypothetical protein [Aliidongia sp.]HEV2677039.1 hypothetical protein [Aliidongia sp.]